VEESRNGGEGGKGNRGRKGKRKGRREEGKEGGSEEERRGKVRENETDWSGKGN
jgi:hypothetical protein